MKKILIKYILVIDLVYKKVLEPLKSNNTIKINERYDLNCK